jgi:hypothetical protein
MFEVVEYNPSIDLKPYFKQAYEEGYIFHTSPKIFTQPGEPVCKSWVVYQSGKIVSSFSLFSLKTVFPDSPQKFSVAGRMCVLKHQTSETRKSIKSFFTEMQNFPQQIVFPTCFKWLEVNYGTNFEPLVMVDVDKIYPYSRGDQILEGFSRFQNVIEKIDTRVVGFKNVSIWRYNVEQFWKLYNTCPKWDVHFPS